MADVRRAIGRAVYAADLTEPVAVRRNLPHP